MKQKGAGTPMLRTETPEVEERRLKLELRLAQMSEVDGCKEDFLKYVRKVWPEFIAGAHNKMIAKKFEDIATGKNKRLIINMPPRHTKSEFASYLFPSWSNYPKTPNCEDHKCVTCHYCKAPTLDQTPNYDSCENCGYWHCYSDGEGWIPEQYQKEKL